MIAHPQRPLRETLWRKKFGRIFYLIYLSMKRILFVVFVLLFLSCKNNSSLKNENTAESEIHFITNIDDAVKDWNTWYNYFYSNIHLAQEFIGLDADSSIIDKKSFLQRIINENVFPVKVSIINNVPYYKLYKLSPDKANIHSTLSQLAGIELSHLEMEGRSLPNFNFTDIKSKVYNNSVMNGKIIILKCWFIHCVSCIEEFPEVNKLADNYKQRKDVLFISLATDSKPKLDSFLKIKPLNYAVIPNMERYMSDELKINMYPTHIVVDKKGKIVKVVNDVNDLIPFLKKELQ